VRLPFCDIPKGEEIYQDSMDWEMPDDYVNDSDTRPLKNQGLLHNEAQMSV